MKVEGGLFIGCAVFFAGSDVVYWYFSHDPTGTAALAFAVGLGFLIGFYVLFTGRRLPRRPEDDLQGEIEQGTGELVAALPRPVLRAGRRRRRYRVVAVYDRHAVRRLLYDRLCLRVLPRRVRALTGRGARRGYAGTRPAR
jgi:Cytochrome c oxidase subunit IV